LGVCATALASFPATTPRKQRAIEAIAVIKTSAIALRNSNLVEICMLTHTSASLSRASIRQDSVLLVLLRKQGNFACQAPGPQGHNFVSTAVQSGQNFC
jgi:hypothetical protein